MVCGQYLPVFLLPSIQSSSSWSLHLRGQFIPSSVAVAICSRILSARPYHHSRTDGVSLKIMHPVALGHKIKNKQITIQHNFIKYSYCYMFRPYGVIIRLTFRTYEEVCTLSNKNPLAWNFLSPEPEVTCGIVAVIIRVVLLPPYLRIRGVSLSSIHYNQSHRVYINRRQQYSCLTWN